MQEAKFSFNFKFNLDGFDCQLTLRSDASGTECIDMATRAIIALSTRGAIPINGRGKEEVKANAAFGHWVAPPLNAEPPLQRLCPVCHKSDELQLISTKYGRRFKCLRCDKWLPKSLQPDAHELADMDDK